MQVTGVVSGAVPFLVWETGGIHGRLLGSSGSRKADRFHQAAVAVLARVSPGCAAVPLVFCSGLLVCGLLRPVTAIVCLFWLFMFEFLNL